MARIRVYKGKYRTTYTATVRIKGYDSVSATFDTKTEAKNWAAQIEAEMRSGRYNNMKSAKKITLDEALSRYFNSITSMKAPNTLMRDEKSIKAIRKHLDCSLSLADITTEKIAHYRDRRLKDVSPSTVMKELALLSHLFKPHSAWSQRPERPSARMRKKGPRPQTVWPRWRTK